MLTNETLMIIMYYRSYTVLQMYVTVCNLLFIWLRKIQINKCNELLKLLVSCI